MNAAPAAFLDRDGVINRDHGYVGRAEDFEFLPGVLAACAILGAWGFRLVVVTNQSGIARGRYTEADFLRLSDWMRGRFAQAGAPLAGVYHCPHHPEGTVAALRRACDCRKPAPGLLLRAIDELGLDPRRSVLFGDKRSDLQAARAAGLARAVLLATDGLHWDPAVPAAEACARHPTLAAAVAAPELARELAGLAGVPRTEPAA